MKNLFESMLIAFSMYSRIPMPRMDWTEERMRYALCFFPLIGAVIGAVEIATFALCEILGAGVLFRTCLLTAVPLLITGGADGRRGESAAGCASDSPACRFQRRNPYGRVS